MEFRIITSKTNKIKLLFWQMIAKFFVVYAKLVWFWLNNIQRINRNLSCHATFGYHKFLVFDEDYGLFASISFKKIEHCSWVISLINIITCVQVRSVAIPITYRPSIRLKSNHCFVFINGDPKAFPKHIKTHFIHKFIFHLIESFKCFCDCFIHRINSFQSFPVSNRSKI